MIVKINGIQQDIEKKVNILDFLTNYLDGKDTKGVAIARNGVMVPRSHWNTTLIDESDEIEIVHAVQGG